MGMPVLDAYGWSRCRNPGQPRAIRRYGRRPSEWNDPQMKAYGRCIWLPEIADVRSSPRRTPDVIATEVSWLPEVPLGLGLEDAIAS